MTSSAKKSKVKPRKPKRSLNALAIAERQNPVQSKFRLNRLSEIERGVPKRKREGEPVTSEPEDNVRHAKKIKDFPKDRHGKEVEAGSDSEGNEWVIGHVDSNDDSDLDSDAAMGESDEDRFEGFVFRGSSTAMPDKKLRAKSVKLGLKVDQSQSIDLREDQDLQLSDEDEDEDDLGNDAIDLAAMVDASDNDVGDSSSAVAVEAHGSDDFGSTSGDVEGPGPPSDEEDSTLSISDNEIDTTDPAKLASLKALVSSMDSRNSTLSENHKLFTDSYQSTTLSDFGLSSTKKLTVADLIPSVTDPRLKKSLKLLAGNEFSPPSKRHDMPKKLEVPLPKRQKDRLDREAAYAKSKEVLDRWMDTVKHNRRAEHLSFPLQDPNAIVTQGRQRLLPRAQLQPVTDLESVIQSILQDSGLAPTKPNVEEVQAEAFEELPKNELSLNEVQARRAELRRARDLLFREETRAKRIKKIKSKSYRRVHRKERERNALQEKDALLAAGVDDPESEKERNDRWRAEERMGARHRESKWGRGVRHSGRAAWDEDARGGVTEMARRGEELRRRIDGGNVEIDESDSSSTESDSDSVEDGAGKKNRKDVSKALSRLEQENGNKDVTSSRIPNAKSNLSSLKFMKNAEALHKARNDAAVETMRKEAAGEQDASSEEDEVEGAGRRSYGPTKNQPSPSKKLPQREYKSELEEKEGSGADDSDSEDLFDDNQLEVVVDTETSKQQSDTVKNVRMGLKHERNHHGSAKDSKRENVENPWLSSKTAARVTDLKARDSHGAAIISNDLAADRISTHTSETRPSIALSNRPTKKGQKTVPVVGASLSTQTFESDSEDDEANKLQFAMRNQDLVRKAFAGDEVVADFQKEKQQTMLDDEEKIIDNTLPGWGNWTGAGISRKEQKRNRGKVLVKVDGIQKEKRLDAKLDKVIINEKRVKKVSRAWGLTVSVIRPLMSIEHQISGFESPASLRDKATVRKVTSTPSWP